MNPEAIDFRAASESFAGLMKLRMAGLMKIRMGGYSDPSSIRETLSVGADTLLLDDH
jgi:hypothetical protein